MPATATTHPLLDGPTAPPPTLHGVLEVLAWDHDRLDALDKAAFEALGRGDLVAARALFAHFARGLDRHIRFEEEFLFPAIEERAGLPPHAGPTAVMRAEHVEIRACLASIAASLAADGAGAAQVHARMLDVLGGHNLKEERILYPMADRALGPADAETLVSELQKLG